MVSPKQGLTLITKINDSRHYEENERILCKIWTVMYIYTYGKISSS